MSEICVKNIRPYLGKFDSWLFHSGKSREFYRKAGAHIIKRDGVSGTVFVLWAPNARECYVITGAAGWDENRFPMKKRAGGIWECFIEGIGEGTVYRYAVLGCDGVLRYKSDPYAFYTEMRPANASIVKKLYTYKWGDREYMKNRRPSDDIKKPVSIYEVHPGSWKKDYSFSEDGFIGYRRLADELCEYVKYMGFTHVELMGICEHPFDGSWGYQVTGLYSPSSRWGEPDDLRYLVDLMHQNGIKVILDWVPAHFPKDVFSLENFDGTCLYEPEDPLLREYPEWGTFAFDHSKPEVKSYLISNAFYWIKEFHVDALRVDAVASMLYTSFGRTEYRVNEDGSTENRESCAFLRELNEAVIENTGCYLIAEDSSIMRGITQSTKEGGLGFLFKWSLGWMNDSLKYIETDPVYRKYSHGMFTGIAGYAFTENFILPLSHDEVVHLKKPVLLKMPGPMPQKYAGIKAYYTYQYMFPGKKLLFMGQEFGELSEWDESREISWGLTHEYEHRQIMLTVKRLNEIYREYPCLHYDKNPVTFEWVNSADSDRNIISFIRRNPWNYEGALLTVINFSPVEYPQFSVGCPKEGGVKRIFSSAPAVWADGALAAESAEAHFNLTEDLCDARPLRLSFPLRPYEAAIFALDTGSVPNGRERS